MAGLVPAIHGHCLNVAVSRSGGFFRILLGHALGKSKPRCIDGCDQLQLGGREISQRIDCLHMRSMQSRYLRGSMNVNRRVV
jgi:hypothetical protein